MRGNSALHSAPSHHQPADGVAQGFLAREGPFCGNGKERRRVLSQGGDGATQDQKPPVQRGGVSWCRVVPDRSFTHGGSIGLWEGRCASTDALTELHPLAHDIPWIP